MKALFVGINAKFIHSNLAIRTIEKYAENLGVVIDTTEYTINQSVDFILDGIWNQCPDLIGFSCYLWNIEIVKKLVVMLKQVRPDCVIVLGGPEVSYDTKILLESLEDVDYIIAGEGEVSGTNLVKHIRDDLPLEALTGLTYRKDGFVTVSAPTPPLDLSLLPFVYEEGLTGLEHRILYYETSRGCPYTCQYCLSAIEKGVRFRPIEMVQKELQFFLDQQVTQIKLVDRTFNAKLSHTLAIWHYLHEHDNGVTNFHFEITADLMHDATLEFLSSVRPGLFQFEVGVQSTNAPTILAVERKVEFQKLKTRVLKVMEGNNIHMHLDLIAGLPKEDYPTFAQSFNDVMAIRPEQLQLGFLKVLKGSKIYYLQKAYGIVYRQFAPYEVLSTHEMSYEDLRRLKAIEVLLETYYNSKQFSTSIQYMMACHDSDFHCFEAMSDYWKEKGYNLLPHNKIRLYELMYDYGITCETVDRELLAQYLKHDLCTREKPKKWPNFVKLEEVYKTSIRNFYQDESNRITLLASYKDYTSKQCSRMAHLERYTYDVLGTGQAIVIWLLYDYKKSDVMTGHACVTAVDLVEDLD